MAWNQLQFIRSPLLHKLDQLDQILLINDSQTRIKFKPYAKQKRNKKMKKLMDDIDDNYFELQIPTEILMEILTFSNDYYDHLLSMHKSLSIYQYIIPQILDVLQFALLVTLLVLPPNCIFLSVLFNVYNVSPIQSRNILDEYYNLFDLNAINNNGTNANDYGYLYRS